MAKVSGVSIEEAILRIKAAGLDSIAGAGAEMLPDRPRKAIAPLKECGARWLEVMAIAHRNGLSSTATMMMGTGETNAERIEHIRMIRDVQDLAVANGYADSAVESSRTSGSRRLPGLHPVDVPAGEQPPQGPHPGHHAWSTCASSRSPGCSSTTSPTCRRPG